MGSPFPIFYFQPSIQFLLIKAPLNSIIVLHIYPKSSNFFKVLPLSIGISLFSSQQSDQLSIPYIALAKGPSVYILEVISVQ